MLELYHFDNSVCSQKVRLALAEKHLEWQDHRVDILNGAQFTPAYLKLNPRAVVPTLIHDGHVIRESTVICEYLDEVFREPPLAPADPLGRAQMRIWTKLPDEDIHSACATVTFTTYFRYTLMKLPPEKLLAMEAKEVDRLAHSAVHPTVLERKHDVIVKGLGAADARRAFKAYDRMLGEMEAALAAGPWLLGDQYTLADLGLTPYIDRLYNLALGPMWIGKRPRVTAWYERIRARPNFSTAIERWLEPTEVDAMRSIGAASWPAVAKLLEAA
ncbi:MAG TPA: glutathione S-transferase family protein [Candidatus Binataceae bacterium]|nr:glutathione S-transferase family protein [Candidatus Binataceae bacterium]